MTRWGDGPGRAMLVLAGLCVLACSAGRDRQAPPAPERPGHAATSRDRTPGSEPTGAGAGQHDVDPGVPLAEAAARALLAERFRAAGFRIRHDVRLQSRALEPGHPAGNPPADGPFDLTVDGYDPDARVGFEYIDPAEAGTDLDAGERAALERATSERILIIDAAPQSAVMARADEFLRRVTTGSQQ